MNNKYPKPKYKIGDLVVVKKIVKDIKDKEFVKLRQLKIIKAFSLRKKDDNGVVWRYIADDDNGYCEEEIIFKL